MSREIRDERRGFESRGCEPIAARLDAYLDGDLPAAEHEVLLRHLETCDACRREVEGLRELLAEARRLPQSVEPPRDLWPAIEARLGNVRAAGLPAPRAPRLRPSRSRLWLPLAAAAVLVAILTAPLVLRWSSPATPTAPLAQAPSPPAQAASRQILAAIERQQDNLTPQTVRSLEASVATLDRSIGEIRTALAESPDDRQLHLWLAERYRQETQLLQQLQLLDARL